MEKHNISIISLLDILLDLAGLVSLISLWIMKDSPATLFKIIAIGVILISFLKDIFIHCSVIEIITETKEDSQFLWRDRKRTFLGLPLSFTRYRLTKEKIILDEGFFNRKENEIRLYRIMDFSVNRTFGQRLLGLGTITVTSSDKTLPTLHIKNVKRSEYVKELISRLVEEERQSKSVTGREIIDHHDDTEDEDCNCYDPLD